MDFTNTTAEALLAHVPEHEDDRWEFKSSQLLDPQKKGDLKKELGKQVSAFANSGGGNIVFGIDEMPRSVRACPELVTRQSMQDYLSTMVEQSVEYPIRCFQVHRIPFEDASKGSIYLIHIEDSPAAPHQAKDERQYYYRISGHSKPAPHFHVELLRSRQTRCIVEPTFGAFEWTLPSFAAKGIELSCFIAIEVRNLASFLAKPVGLSVSPTFPSAHWQLVGEKSRKTRATVISREFLYPGLSTTFVLHLKCRASENESVIDIACNELNAVSLQIKAFSQNYGSTEIRLTLAGCLTPDMVRAKEVENDAERARSKENTQKLVEEYKPKIKAAMDQVHRDLIR